MTKINLLELAKQGNEEAIATLLNLALEHKQTTALVRLGGYHVLVQI